jgi:O-acetyl-ADP-ribose deacetylase (regulator of RNase III)
MKVKVGRTDIVIERGDITEWEVDAIVNAANSHLWMGAGVAGAIKKKGGVIIEEEAVRQGPIEVGEAVLTTAGNLVATHVIHAAAMGQDLKTDGQKITQATRSSLAIAEKRKLTSIAFPALGTGVGGFPPGQAAAAMLGAVLEHLKTGTSSLTKIVFVLYQDEAFKAFGETLERLRPGR